MWQCPFCDFSNHENDLLCGICTAPKESHKCKNCQRFSYNKVCDCEFIATKPDGQALYFDKFNISSWDTIEVKIDNNKNISESKTVLATSDQNPISELNNRSHSGWTIIHVEDLAQTEKDDKICQICGSDHETQFHPTYPSVSTDSDSEYDSYDELDLYTPEVELYVLADRIDE